MGRPRKNPDPEKVRVAEGLANPAVSRGKPLPAHTHKSFVPKMGTPKTVPTQAELEQTCKEKSHNDYVLAEHPDFKIIVCQRCGKYTKKAKAGK